MRLRSGFKYMNNLLNEKDLKIIKNLELKIAVQIKTICDKHKIKYAIAFGTLLGAVRHGGFIPWDDDIDIAMIRSEYDKFLLVASEDLSNEYVIVNYENEPGAGEPFTKIMLRDAVVMEIFAQNASIPHYVFVDVFPYDGTPDNMIAKQVHRFTNYQLRKRILIKSGYNFRKTGIKKLIYDLIKLTLHCSKNKLVNSYRKNEVRYSSSNTENVVALGGNYGYIKDTIPRSWFESYTVLKFEGIEFSTFEKYIDFLKHYYGEFMQLPPSEKQINKHTVAKLDLTRFGGRKIP